MMVFAEISLNVAPGPFLVDRVAMHWFAGPAIIIGIVKDCHNEEMKIRLLRFFLCAAAVTWGAAVFGVFVSWSKAAEFLEGLGAKPIAYDPMLDYWLRMAAGAFTLIGCW